MGESIKALLALFFIVATIVACVVWADDRPTAVVWNVRIVATLVAVLSVGSLLKLHFRRDLAPDFLRQTAGEYYNRDGFCFAFAAVEVDGVCQFQAFFQNQFERPCLGRIALRPARGFFLTRAKIESLTFEIPCDGAAYGVATLPLPLPSAMFGKKQAFEVGASVTYPEGKGKRMRFHDGIFLRANTNFGDSFGTALTIAGALTGSIVYSSPATVTLQLPSTAAEEVPSDAQASLTVFWKLGDPLTS
jgi:hypothetical protein